MSMCEYMSYDSSTNKDLSMSKMSSLVFWGSGLGMTLIWSVPFSINFFSLVWTDLMSSGMLWLTLSSVALSYISAKTSKSLWWATFVVVSISFLSKSLLMFFILFELSIIPILLMILFWGAQPERLSAGLYFLIYTGSFSIPYLVFIMFLLPKASFSFKVDSELPMLTMFVCLAPFLVKMPVFMLHFWLPKAHVEASTSGSMILAGLLLKLGSFGGYRVVVLLGGSLLSKTLSMWMVGALISSIVTFMQSDLKKLIAYSSVTHMTFMMLGLSSNMKQLLLSVLMLSLAHGWASIMMFLKAGSLSHSVSSRFNMLVSSEQKFSWSVLFLGVALMSNASLPPFPSFFPEVGFLFTLLLSTNLSILFLFMSLSVCYYNSYLFLVTLTPSKSAPLGKMDQSELFSSMCITLVTLISVFWMVFL